MTKVGRKNVKCIKCGEESEQKIVYSVNFSLGTKEQNEQLMNHLQKCEHCGYEARDISAELEEYKSESKEQEIDELIGKIDTMIKEIEDEEKRSPKNQIIKELTDKVNLYEKILKHIANSIDLIKKLVENEENEEMKNHTKIMQYEILLRHISATIKSVSKSDEEENDNYNAVSEDTSLNRFTNDVKFHRNTTFINEVPEEEEIVEEEEPTVELPTYEEFMEQQDLEEESEENVEETIEEESEENAEEETIEEDNNFEVVEEQPIEEENNDFTQTEETFEEEVVEETVVEEEVVEETPEEPTVEVEETPEDNTTEEEHTEEESDDENEIEQSDEEDHDEDEEEHDDDDDEEDHDDNDDDENSEYEKTEEEIALEEEIERLKEQLEEEEKKEEQTVEDELELELRPIEEPAEEPVVEEAPIVEEENKETSVEDEEEKNFETPEESTLDKIKRKFKFNPFGGSRNEDKIEELEEKDKLEKEYGIGSLIPLSKDEIKEQEEINKREYNINNINSIELHNKTKDINYKIRITRLDSEETSISYEDLKNNEKEIIVKNLDNIEYPQLVETLKMITNKWDCIYNEEKDEGIDFWEIIIDKDNGKSKYTGNSSKPKSWDMYEEFLSILLTKFN